MTLSPVSYTHLDVYKRQEQIDGPEITLTDNEKYCAFARFCDAKGRVWNCLLYTSKFAMKISLNWLKSYIETSLPAEEIAKILTDIGLEVEGLEQIETVRGGLSGLVVGEVLTCEKHPDADKLHVTTVDLGDGAPTQIVCGAPNVAAGQKVVVATINTMLYPTGEAEGCLLYTSRCV